MAWIADNIADYVRVSSNSALNLPDGDWTRVMLLKATDGNSLSTSPTRVLTRNEDGVTGTFDLGITNGGIGAAYDEVTVTVVDNDGTSGSGTSTASPFAGGTTAWKSVIMERESSTIKVYVDNVEVISFAVGSIDAIGSDGTGPFSGDLVLLNRERSPAPEKGFKGAIAEVAQFNRALSGTERGLLWNGSSGQSPMAMSGGAPAWYIPAYSGDYTEKVVGLTVTNSGTAGATHPSIAYPLAMPLLSVTPTLHAPTLAATYSLAMPALSVAPTFYDHEFTQDTGEQTLEPPLLNNGVTFHNPTFAPGSVSASPPLLSVAPTLYNPAFSATYALTMPLLSVTATLHAPALHATYALTAPHLTNTPTFYNATFAATYRLQPPLLDVSPTLYSHSLPGQNITVQAPVLSVPPAFFAHLMREKWTNADTVSPGVWTDTDFPYQEI